MDVRLCRGECVGWDERLAGEKKMVWLCMSQRSVVSAVAAPVASGMHLEHTRVLFKQKFELGGALHRAARVQINQVMNDTVASNFNSRLRGFAVYDNEPCSNVREHHNELREYSTVTTAV